MNLINLWEMSDHRLFDNIVIPNELDHDILVNNILLKCGEYDPIITYPSLMENAIRNFFYKYQETFQNMCDALKLKYEKIENYDRIEESTNSDLSNSNNQSNSVDTNKVSAYDSNSFINDSTNQNESNDSNQRESTFKTNSHIHGNIGVTTSQQMLESEIALREKYNIYDIITKYFFKEFMIHCL